MKLSPYFAFAKKSFLQKSAYRLDHWMGILNTLIRLVIYIEIYCRAEETSPRRVSGT